MYQEACYFYIWFRMTLKKRIHSQFYGAFGISQTLCWMLRIFRVIKAEVIPAFMKFTVHVGDRGALEARWRSQP